MNKQTPNTTVTEELQVPLLKALAESSSTRKCSNYSDMEFLKGGVQRVLEYVESGRRIAQSLIHNGCKLTVSNFFRAFKSKRRLELVSEINGNIRAQTDRMIELSEEDPLAEHEELAGFAIYASDGHTHGASAHEKWIKEKKRPVTDIFALNLRTHSLSHIGLTEPREGMKKEHEIATLKRVGATKLRMGEPTGTRVIHVYDPAVIDYIQWFKWKQGSGIYVITREKSNSILTVTEETQWDKADPRNAGVISDELVKSANGVHLRRVTYDDPTTGIRYRYLTNEMTIPPGLIAFLYKLRWDVEKVFDEIKNKHFERKAWAASETAKKQQARFICITMNLLRIMQVRLLREEGISDSKSEEKRIRRSKEADQKAVEAGRTPNCLVSNLTRVTQRSLQFLRWLKDCRTNRTLWREGIELLRPLMRQYLH